MIDRQDLKVRLVPVDQIIVLNPRTRGKNKFKQIVDNIAHIGLKKPITVALSSENLAQTEYVLVCGQGRLEAFKVLGQAEIPAVVINGTKADFLLISLAENIARRLHSHVELVNNIRNLKDRGYSFSEIARKTDLGSKYVRDIVQLLDDGEDRLVRAVERGQIPITIAITIARSDDEGIQKALTEAYESNSLRGKQLLQARRLIENRKIKKAGTGANRNGQRISSEGLLRTYQRETKRQRFAIQKAKICETQLFFAVSAMRRLFEDENFVTLLRAESLLSLPQFLTQQISKKGGEQ